MHVTGHVRVGPWGRPLSPALASFVLQSCIVVAEHADLDVIHIFYRFVTVGASYANLVIYLKSHAPQFRRRNYGWKRRDAGANNKGAISFDHRAHNC